MIILVVLFVLKVKRVLCCTYNFKVPKNGIFRLDYLCSIGDKDAATALATTKYEDSTLTTNRRLDAIFALFRIAYFHGCNVKEMGKTINKVIPDILTIL